MWFWIIIVIAAVGAIIGYCSSEKDKGSGALGGALAGGLGCGYVIFQIFIWGVGVLVLIWLFNLLFS